jgi:hypothetical protein
MQSWANAAGPIAITANTNLNNTTIITITITIMTKVHSKLIGAPALIYKLVSSCH